MDRDRVAEYIEWGLTKPNPWMEGTAAAYERELRFLEKHAGKRAEDVDAADLRSYQAAHRNDTDSSWNGRYAALIGFLRWLKKEGFYREVDEHGRRRSDPSEAISRRKGLKKRVPRPVDVVAEISQMPKGRYKTIALFLYTSGFTIGEAESIDEPPKDGKMHVRRWGGTREWVEPNSKDALRLLDELGGRVVTEGSKPRTLQRRLPVKPSEIQQASERDFQMRKGFGGAPVWELFAGRPDLLDVARAYRDATESIEGPNPDPKNAITDAARSLQEMLVTMGAKGNSLRPLFDNARSRGLFKGHDLKLFAALESLIDWVNADRSERGDAHKETGAGTDDAVMALRIVAALLLRLEALKMP